MAQLVPWLTEIKDGDFPWFSIVLTGRLPSGKPTKELLNMAIYSEFSH